MNLEEKIERLENKFNELVEKVNNNYDDINANINRLHSHEQKINDNEQKIGNNATAIDILHTSEANGKRIFVVLIIVIILWFATIGAFLYYINTTGYVETTEIADTSDGGNACVGDNCNNGVINGKGD